MTADTEVLWNRVRPGGLVTRHTPRIAVACGSHALIHRGSTQVPSVPART